MNDLTVLMLTPNKVPKQWAAYHKKMLLEAIEDTPLITISAEPLDFGTNLIQTEYSLENIYRQMLRGAKTATTEWIAMADDDTLYPKQHFMYRPPKEGYYYNLNRWHIFSWGEPFYFHKPRHGNGLLITTRELMISALENRFTLGAPLPGYAQHEFGTKPEMKQFEKYEATGFYTKEPVLSFYHEESIDEANRNRKKYAWPVRAYDIPVWGRAEEIRKRFV